MGISFRKSIKLFNGVNLNLSKSGAGISFGPRGARFSVNTSGKANATLGIPGTGVSYRKSISLFNVIKNFFGGNSEKEEQIKQEREVIPKVEEPSYDSQIDPITILTSIHRSQDEVVDWNRINSEQSGKLANFAKEVLNGDDETYLKVIEIAQPFNDLVDLASDFEVGVVDDEFMGVNFNLLSIDEIPDTTTTILKSGKMSEKKISNGAKNEIYRDYASSISIRVARDVFALVPVSKVGVNASVKRISPMTGNEEEITVISVVFDREKMNTINFNNVQPFEALKNFENNVNFKKTTGFNEVLPLS